MARRIKTERQHLPLFTGEYVLKRKIIEEQPSLLLKYIREDVNKYLIVYGTPDFFSAAAEWIAGRIQEIKKVNPEETCSSILAMIMCYHFPEHRELFFSWLERTDRAELAASVALEFNNKVFKDALFCAKGEFAKQIKYACLYTPFDSGLWMTGLKDSYWREHPDEYINARFLTLSNLYY